VGPVANTLTTRPARAAVMEDDIEVKATSDYFASLQVSIDCEEAEAVLHSFGSVSAGRLSIGSCSN
jgi:hypothetical protein